MKISFYGHNCLGIQIGDTQLLIDPFISGNPLIGDQVDKDQLEADYIKL